MNLSELFVSYWFRWDGNITAVNCKLLVPANPACNTNYYYSGPGVGATYTPTTSMNWISNDDYNDSCSHEQWITIWETEYRPGTDQWIRGEFFGIESSANQEDGTVSWKMQMTTGGQFITIMDFNGNANTRVEADEHWKASVFGRYTGGTTSGYDDIYIADSRARVEFGNNESFKNCTHREIQIPHTVWNSSHIEITINQGSFADGEDAFLFVVDENGTASDGYPITLSVGTHPADLNSDDDINSTEIRNYVSQWRRNSVSISSLFEAVELWKQG